MQAPPESYAVVAKKKLAVALFSWVKFENLATVALSFLFDN